MFISKIKVLLGHRVIQVACGSRDAQTLALTDEGKVTLPKGQARITHMIFLRIFELFFNLGTLQFVACDILHAFFFQDWCSPGVMGILGSLVVEAVRAATSHKTLRD